MPPRKTKTAYGALKWFNNPPVIARVLAPVAFSLKEGELMRRSILILFTFCILLSFVIPALATDERIISAPARAFSEEEKTEVEKHLGLKVIDDDNLKTGICAFAVSETGEVAVVTKHGRLYVYDTDGIFQYGFLFDLQSACGIAFSGENVAIYFVRGDYIAIYDSSGNCVSMKEIKYPDYDLIHQFLHRTQIRHAGKNYSLERDLVISDTYARLVITDEDGNRNVIYDSSWQHSIETVLLIMGIIGLFAFVIWGIWKQDQELESMEGVWYCAELNMQVSLDDYQNAFFLDNGEKVWCKCYLSVSKITVLEVFCREYEHPQYRHGKTIFVGDVKHYDGMSMRVYGRRSRREYMFVRTDKVETIH